MTYLNTQLAISLRPDFDWEPKYYVYIYYDPRNNLPFYVGKGKGDRYLSHLSEQNSDNGNNQKFNKIKEIQSEGLEPEIKFWDVKLFEDEAFNIETMLIMHFGRIDYEDYGILTNICLYARPPNMKGRNWVSNIESRKETIRNIGHLNKGKIAWNKDKTWEKIYGEVEGKILKEKMGKSNKGNTSFLGQHHTEESKELMRLAKEGITGEKASFYGHHHSGESKQIIGDKTKKWLETHDNAMLGKKHTEEVREFNRELNSNTYELTSPNGEVFETKRLKLFCSEHQVNYSAMTGNARSKNETPHHSGWKCRLIHLGAGNAKKLNQVISENSASTTLLSGLSED